MLNGKRKIAEAGLLAYWMKERNLTVESGIPLPHGLSPFMQGVLEGPGDSIEWLSWHPRGHVLLAGSADYTCWMWNADTGAFMQLFSGHSASGRQCAAHRRDC